jgi:hypothetical protein
LRFGQAGGGHLFFQLGTRKLVQFALESVGGRLARAHKIVRMSKQQGLPYRKQSLENSVSEEKLILTNHTQ